MGIDINEAFELVASKFQDGPFYKFRCFDDPNNDDIVYQSIWLANAFIDSLPESIAEKYDAFGKIKKILKGLAKDLSKNDETTEECDNELPKSHKAEQSIIGCLLLDSSLFNEVSQVLSEKDFYFKNHKIIFSAIKAIASKTDKFDVLCIFDLLSDLGLLTEIGGPTYLYGLLHHIPSVANFKGYMEIVKEKSKLRSLIKVSKDIVNFSENITTENPEQIFEFIESKVGEIRSSVGTKNSKTN